MPIIPRIEQQSYPQYYVEMYSPTTWECVPNSRIEMDPHEHILAQKTVFLKSEASLSGRKQYIAIGTSNICGEDYQREHSGFYFNFDFRLDLDRAEKEKNNSIKVTQNTKYI